MAATLIAVSVSTLLAQTPDATSVLSSAREALGGEKKLSAVRTFTATGRTMATADFPADAEDQRKLRPDQCNAFVAALLGWTMDAFDYFVVVLV